MRLWYVLGSVVVVAGAFTLALTAPLVLPLVMVLMLVAGGVVLAGVSVLDQQREALHNQNRPYTAADFPCPDPFPGREAPTRTGAFAIVWPNVAASEAELRELGQLLTAWNQRSPDVATIEGLELLLSGRPPKSALTMSGPLSFDSKQEVSDPLPCFATVSLTQGTDAKRLGEELVHLIESRRMGKVESADYYEFMQR